MNVILSILALAIVFLIYRKVKSALGIYKCIPAQTMKSYKLDRLSQEDRKMVTTHLGVCEKCQQDMIDLDPDLEIE